jgi:hypothetical protein
MASGHSSRIGRPTHLQLRRDLFFVDVERAKAGRRSPTKSYVGFAELAGVRRKRQPQRRGGTPAASSNAIGSRSVVDLLMTAARRGEWRVVALMLDRVFGGTKETVALEQAEPEIISDLRALTPEERRDLLRRWNEEPDEAAEAG